MSSEIFHSKVVSFASYIPNQFVPLNDYASINHLPGKLDLHRLTGLEGHRKSKVEEGSLELSVKAQRHASLEEISSQRILTW